MPINQKQHLSYPCHPSRVLNTQQKEQDKTKSVNIHDGDGCYDEAFLWWGAHWANKVGWVDVAEDQGVLTSPNVTGVVHWELHELQVVEDVEDNFQYREWEVVGRGVENEERQKSMSKSLLLGCWALGILFTLHF